MKISTCGDAITCSKNVLIVFRVARDVWKEMGVIQSSVQGKDIKNMGKIVWHLNSFQFKGILKACVFLCISLTEIRFSPPPSRKHTDYFCCKSSWFELGPHTLRVQHQKVVCKPLAGCSQHIRSAVSPDINFTPSSEITSCPLHAALEALFHLFTGAQRLSSNNLNSTMKAHN